MGFAYDLRFWRKVIEAVDAGSSARSAAGRFGIGVATAIRWVRCWRETGKLNDPPARKRRSVFWGHADWLIDLRTSEPKLRLIDIAARLEETHGVRTDKAALSRFFKRAGVTYKKGACLRLNNCVAMLRLPAGFGGAVKVSLILKSLCSLMKWGQRQIWRAVMAGRCVVNGISRGLRMGIGRPQPLSLA